MGIVKMRNFFLGFLIFVFSFLNASAEPKESCIEAPFKVAGNDIILAQNPSQKSAHVFFFQNKANHSIFIDHPVENPGASAGWSTYLRPGNWAALVINKKNFAIHCARIEPGQVVALNCQHTINVCNPKELSANTKFKGNYWLAEDRNWDSFVKILEKKGIVVN